MQWYVIKVSIGLVDHFDEHLDAVFEFEPEIATSIMAWGKPRFSVPKEFILFNT